MPERRGRPGPVLPYRLIAGVVPCEGGWLVAGGRLHGVTVTVVEPVVVATLTDVLDSRPAFDVVALAVPVGLPDAYVAGGRSCDRAARRLLGRRRGSAVMSAPSRCALDAGRLEEAVALGHVSAAAWHLMPWIREVDKHMEPFRQRSVFGVHPELSFLRLNGTVPLRWPKHSAVGRAERRELLEAQFPDLARMLGAVAADEDQWRALDGYACLWTARRTVARAVERLPELPDWDSTGLRMELVW